MHEGSCAVHTSNSGCVRITTSWPCARGSQPHLQGGRRHGGVLAGAQQLLHRDVCHVEAEAGGGVSIAGRQHLVQQELAVGCSGCGAPAASEHCQPCLTRQKLLRLRLQASTCPASSSPSASEGCRPLQQHRRSSLLHALDGLQQHNMVPAAWNILLIALPAPGLCKSKGGALSKLSVWEHLPAPAQCIQIDAAAALAADSTSMPMKGLLITKIDS